MVRSSSTTRIYLLLSESVIAAFKEIYCALIGSYKTLNKAIIGGVRLCAVCQELAGGMQAYAALM